MNRLRGLRRLMILFLVPLGILWLTSCAKIPTEKVNDPPRFRERIKASSNQFHPGETIAFTIQVEDPEDDPISSHWLFSTGNVLGTSQDSASWVAPDSSQEVVVIVQVEDNHGNFSADTATFQNENRAPLIQGLHASSLSVINGNTISIWANAVDPDSHNVYFSWFSRDGDILENFQDSIRWQAPDTTVDSWVSMAAYDDFGAISRDTLRLTVYRELGCVWICNEGAGEVVKMSSIGSEILRIGNFDKPVAIDVDSEYRFVWVADQIAGTVYKINFDGEIQTALTGFVNPVSLKASSRTGRCWVVDADSAVVKQVARNGTQILNVVRGFNQPNDVDVNTRTGEVWITDAGAGILYRLTGDLPPILNVSDTTYVQAVQGLVWPYSVAVEEATDACWVTDRGTGTVYRYGPDLSDTLQVSGFDSPLDVVSTQYEALVWIADRSANGKVVRLFYNDIQITVDGLNFPKAMAVNLADGVCWALDTERNRILRISDAGQILSEITNFDYPTAIAINTDL